MYIQVTNRCNRNIRFTKNCLYEDIVITPIGDVYSCGCLKLNVGNVLQKEQLLYNLNILRKAIDETQECVKYHKKLYHKLIS